MAIESILLKDISFSIELQQSLSSAATQKRIGEGKVIAARAEVDAAKLMRQGESTSLPLRPVPPGLGDYRRAVRRKLTTVAADILASPAAMQIRQLEALQNMARTSSSKVVFGMSLRFSIFYPIRDYLVLMIDSTNEPRHNGSRRNG